ncbi:hypothetical protein QBC44DRAFT_385180 [Cladorrhinum sp. PSN332]|nr:hypothetical protein QBC44DRAFT_385180 [Cladorrhinum sp. PSN332]
MGYFYGFDFIDAIIERYSEVADDDAHTADKKILTLPRRDDPTLPPRKRVFIHFEIGDRPHIPISPDHCYYFIRFYSDVGNEPCAALRIRKYIDGVYGIAQEYFNDRVDKWDERKGFTGSPESRVTCHYTRAQAEHNEHGFLRLKCVVGESNTRPDDGNAAEGKKEEE